MISYVKGELVSLTEDLAIIENNGIGYNIHIPSAASFGGLEPGMTVKIYTYMNVREDDISLFGFVSEDDLACFKMLITVSGIGPKNALSILSVLSASDLKVAIISGDAKAISSAPGVGKKSAERVILELKDKIDMEGLLTGVTAGESAITGKVGTAAAGGTFTEVVEALVSMGASDSEAYKAARGVEGAENLSVDAYLKAALKIVRF